jgi:hypothetical protein
MLDESLDALDLGTHVPVFATALGEKDSERAPFAPGANGAARSPLQVLVNEERTPARRLLSHPLIEPLWEGGEAWVGSFGT